MPRSKQEVASDYGGLGAIEAKRGNRAVSLDYLGRAVAMSRALEGENPDNVELRIATALALIERGRALVRFNDGAGRRARLHRGRSGPSKPCRKPARLKAPMSRRWRPRARSWPRSARGNGPRTIPQ